MIKERLNEITAVILLSLSVIVLISLISYTPGDISFYTSHPNVPARNLVRAFGAYLSWALIFSFGWSSFIFPLALFWLAIRKFSKTSQRSWPQAIGFLVLLLSLSSLLCLLPASPREVFQKGGLAGFIFSGFLVKYFGRPGAIIILATFLVLSLSVSAELSLVSLAQVLRSRFKVTVSRKKGPQVIGGRRQIGEKPIPREVSIKTRETQDRPNKQEKEEVQPPVILRAVKKTTEPTTQKEDHLKQRLARPAKSGEYQLPGLELLDSPPPVKEREIKEDLQANARILEETLSDFGIEARVAEIERGPVITRYELEPSPGVKVQRIVALSDDIALAMKAQSVRIVAPIPGKARVGVEVPNIQTAVVYLKEVLQSNEFVGSPSKLTLGLGKDIAGQPLIADLREMPHLLIAGTTGSGKTVCVNSLITSLLFRAGPDEVKLLMVDPKMVELAMFNDLPHLLCPVVTDPKKVQAALNWLVNEMDSRYSLLAQAGTRNIDAYNQKNEPILPFIVVIIDELADLMAVASAEVENAITRLAQLSRAVGIHMVLATQRPSVDVITGTIKANFPARISFKVASKVDSRTVLDANGADKLLGKGDMLFLKPGLARLIRAQGSLLKDSEIERVVEFIKAQRGPYYNDQILDQPQKTRFRDFTKDELFDEAVRVILESGQASVSILQRRLGLGYTRAARLIDAMEQEGIVGPYRGSKPREILVKRDESNQ
jgi:S-DNA-T family DNA segregation ATPase FtsK/SpoIIIE